MRPVPGDASLSTEATIDHLVVTAPNLKSGVQWLRDALGVTAQMGGKHERMGTHNCLLRLGADVYLEVISPDPNAPGPGRPRWFELDKAHRDSQPRLATWVVRTGDIQCAVSNCTETTGAIEPMSRGELNWLITVTDDGGMQLGGAAPAMIQWQTPIHPAQRLREQGCKLLELRLHHPEPERVERMLQSIRLNTEPVVVVDSGAQARLVATIWTPSGIKSLPAV
jgi:hypothetical protein